MKQLQIEKVTAFFIEYINEDIEAGIKQFSFCLISPYFMAICFVFICSFQNERSRISPASILTTPR
jgi:hypothetical protein